MIGHRETRGPPNPIASLLGLGDGSSTLAAIASIAGSQIRRHEIRNREERGLGSGIEGREATFQMTVPNELIGCIIGKGGSKVAEIRSVLIQTLNQGIAVPFLKQLRASFQSEILQDFHLTFGRQE